MKAHLEYNPGLQGYSMSILRPHGPQQQAIFWPEMRTTTIDQGSYLDRSYTTTIDAVTLQAIVDAAFEQGIKPTGYTSDDATKYHLEDMRRLVFDRKEI